MIASRRRLQAKGNELVVAARHRAVAPAREITVPYPRSCLCHADPARILSQSPRGEESNDLLGRRANPLPEQFPIAVDCHSPEVEASRAVECLADLPLDQVGGPGSRGVA